MEFSGFLQMAFKHFLVAALALALVCFQLVESERDQYENRQDKSHAVLPLSEATDSMLQVGVPRRPSSIKKETNTGVEAVFDAGVGETDRRKRAFSRWDGQQAQLTGYESFTRWKPPVYQLSRPYFIPIYGYPGRVPMYFPPQPLYVNPGTPVDNPMPFTGPGYLPPTPTAPTTTKKPDSVVIVNKAGDYDEDDDDDDRPVWSNSPTTQRPNTIIPTRPPRPPSTSDFPPLVHQIQNSGSGAGVNLLGAESQNEPSLSNALVRPSQRTTPRPTASGPSNCVWAIVSCCSTGSNNIPNSCFEQRGCPGPFWGPSPCDSEYAKAAIAAALNYYSQ